MPEGVSEIRFNYETPGLRFGLLITLGGCIVFLLYMLIFFVYSKKHYVKNDYPEGEILIKGWVKAEEEIADVVVDDRNQSLLDKIEDIKIPKIENGFDGGFKIIPNDDKKE